MVFASLLGSDARDGKTVGGRQSANCWRLRAEVDDERLLGGIDWLSASVSSVGSEASSPAM
jgi:hypothetical protein